MKKGISAVVIIFFIACSQYKSENKEVKTPAANPALDSVQSAINAALDYHTAASNNYDLKACGELFTDDASVIEYTEPVKKLNGKAEIDSSIAQELVEFKKANMKFDVEWTTHSLRLAGDKAYHDATVAYTINSPGAEPTRVSAESIMVWKKTGPGKWLVHTLILYTN